MTLSKRISQVADYKSLSIHQLEKKIGASVGVISRSISKGTDLQSKWIIKILDNFHNVDANWLLTGEGEMLKENSKAIAVPTDEIEALKKENEELRKDNQRLKKMIDKLL